VIGLVEGMVARLRPASGRAAELVKSGT